MIYGSVFAGIGGFDLAFDRAGMSCAWQVEKDAKCNGVLSRHWPNVKKHNDIATARGDDLEAVDVICGGFPCQDLSVAGKRAGLAGQRSGLFFELMQLIGELHPQWIVLENVPGLLSSNGGRDMAAVVGEVEKCGYGWAYRVLDARYFGVPQRRRRVFVVGCLGGWNCAAEVLFEQSCLRGNPAPRRQKKQEIAGTLGSGTKRSGWQCDLDRSGAFVHAALISNQGVNAERVIPWNIIGLGQQGSNHAYWTEVSGCLQSKGLSASGNEAGTLIQQRLTVRRLTPRECERLQGFPDDWTAHGNDNKPISDSARYRMIGNAVAVPCVEWIGRRLVAVHSLIKGDLQRG